uniref:Transmembrane protein n=1 Tax=Gossypium raimondii TaxID=29730 RepID=A0A0D2VTE8_GOSRA|nr:hypothetical protein B456_011G000200 [Gossypium raimondii]
MIIYGGDCEDSCMHICFLFHTGRCLHSLVRIGYISFKIVGIVRVRVRVLPSWLRRKKLPLLLLPPILLQCQPSPMFLLLLLFINFFF